MSRTALFLSALLLSCSRILAAAVPVHAPAFPARRQLGTDSGTHRERCRHHSNRQHAAFDTEWNTTPATGFVIDAKRGLILTIGMSSRRDL